MATRRSFASSWQPGSASCSRALPTRCSARFRLGWSGQPHLGRGSHGGAPGSDRGPAPRGQDGRDPARRGPRRRLPRRAGVARVDHRQGRAGGPARPARSPQSRIDLPRRGRERRLLHRARRPARGAGGPSRRFRAERERMRGDSRERGSERSRERRDRRAGDIGPGRAKASSKTPQRRQRHSWPKRLQPPCQCGRLRSTGSWPRGPSSHPMSSRSTSRVTNRQRSAE